MSKVLITKDHLDNIANSLRIKHNTDIKYKLSEMATSVLNIQGGEQPLWYEGQMYYENLVIPEGITEIISYAYYTFKGIKSLTLPSTLIEIKGLAFHKVSKLTDVVIPHGVTTIGNTAFEQCGLVNLYLPNTITSMSGFAPYSPFRNNGSTLETVTLEDGFLCDLCLTGSSQPTKLTIESIINMFNALGVVPEGETRTLTLGATNLAKLTDEQKLIATNKGWTLSS